MSTLQDLLAEALSYLSVCEVAFVQAVSYESKPPPSWLPRQCWLHESPPSQSTHLLRGLTEDELNLGWYLDSVALRRQGPHNDVVSE